MKKSNSIDVVETQRNLQNIALELEPLQTTPLKAMKNLEKFKNQVPKPNV